jgi:hypothetical protein
MEPYDSLPCSQEPTISPCHEPHHTIIPYFFKIHFNIIPQLRLELPRETEILYLIKIISNKFRNRVSALPQTNLSAKFEEAFSFRWKIIRKSYKNLSIVDHAQEMKEVIMGTLKPSAEEGIVDLPKQFRKSPSVNQ